MVMSLPERESRNVRVILTSAVRNGPTANPHCATPATLGLWPESLTNVRSRASGNEPG
jgi:hypothetical protein